jgi:hypothetical protein
MTGGTALTRENASMRYDLVEIFQKTRFPGGDPPLCQSILHAHFQALIILIRQIVMSPFVNPFKANSNRLNSINHVRTANDYYESRFVHGANYSRREK